MRRNLIADPIAFRMKRGPSSRFNHDQQIQQSVERPQRGQETHSFRICCATALTPHPSFSGIYALAVTPNTADPRAASQSITTGALKVSFLKLAKYHVSKMTLPVCSHMEAPMTSARRRGFFMAKYLRSKTDREQFGKDREGLR